MATTEDFGILCCSLQKIAPPKEQARKERANAHPRHCSESFLNYNSRSIVNNEARAAVDERRSRPYSLR